MKLFANRSSLADSRFANGGFAASKKFLVRMLPLVLIASVHAWATLGGDASTVQSDQVKMQATRNVTQAAAYAVHEMKVSSGGVIREYVSPEGKVFGVAWQGPGFPDMQQLLGTYYGRVAQVQKSNRARARRQPVVINDSSLVFLMGGHPRSFSGVAYVPQMMPQGVRADEIR
jgi:hypothetical protein